MGRSTERFVSSLLEDTLLMWMNPRASRRPLPHRARAFIPQRLRRLIRSSAAAWLAAWRAARTTILSSRAETASADQRWSDEARLWESIAGHSKQVPVGAFIRLTRAHRRAGDPDRALEAIQRGLTKYPADLRLATEHARHAVTEEDWGAAALRWQAVIDLAEDPPRTPYLARLELLERAAQEPWGSIVREVREENGDVVAPVSMAHVSVVPLGRFSGFDNRAQARARSRHYLNLALAYQNQGEYALASSVLARGIQRYPDDRKLVKAYAQNATRARDWPAAVEGWEALLQLRESSPPIRAFVELARAHQMLGDFVKVRSTIERGFEQNGEHPSLFAALAKLAMAERNWHQAVVHWQEVLARRQGPKAYRGLLRAYSGQGDFGAAARVLNSARERFPSEPILAVDAIILLIAQGRWDDARAEWEAQVADGVDINAQQYVALANRCSVNFGPELGDLLIEHALKEFPDSTDVRRQAVRNAVFREKRQRPPREWNWDSAFRTAVNLVVSAPQGDSEATCLAVAHELTEAGALAEAREVLHTHLERRGASGEVLGELFALAMAQCDWEHAVEYVLAKRELVGALHVSELVGMARARIAACHFDSARELLGEPAVSSPHYLRLRFERALLEAADGRVDLAASVLEYLLKEGAGSASVAVYRQLSVFYRLLGDEAASSRVVKEARERLGSSALESSPGVVAIIGGGPSLRGVDLEALRGLVHCVAVNATAMALPWCDVAVTHDVNHLAERFHGFGGPVVAGVSPEFMVHRGRLRRVEYRRRVVTDRLSELDGVLHSGGHTSAHTALGYAYLLRPRRIVIFGMDLTAFWGPDEYWHDKADQFNRRGFEDRRQRAGFERWEQYRRVKLTDAPNIFASTLPQLRRQGVEVVNASLESTVECFPKVTPQDGIELCMDADLGALRT